MKTDIISIDNKGKGFKEAIEVTKVAAQFKDLKYKDSIKLQLCTEELLSMARSITGEMEGDFWVECDDEKFELTLSTQTVMDKEKRQTLISASSNKRNEAATSFLGMLRDSFEQAMLADTDSTFYELPNDVASDVVGQYVEDPEWDRYEQSVLRRIADDIKISIRGGKVLMVVTKLICR